MKAFVSANYNLLVIELSMIERYGNLLSEHVYDELLHYVLLYQCKYSSRTPA